MLWSVLFALAVAAAPDLDELVLSQPKPRPIEVRNLESLIFSDKYNKKLVRFAYKPKIVTI